MRAARPPDRHGRCCRHRPAGADRRVRNVREHFGEQRQVLAHERRALRRPHPHERTERQRPALQDGLGRFVLEEVEVDHVLRRRQAHVEDRDQALAARQQLRPRAELGEQGVDLLARARAVVGERRGLHGAAADPLGSGVATAARPAGRRTRRPARRRDLRRERPQHLVDRRSPPASRARCPRTGSRPSASV